MNDEMALAKTIGILFMSRTYAHMAHLKTKSFAKHKALNEFYDEIVDLADALAEAAQGKYGRLDIPFIDMNEDVEDPINGIKKHLTMVENCAKKFDDAYLDNIFQEIQALYRKTLYLMIELD